MNLEKRGVAMRVSSSSNVRPLWKYKKGLEKLETRRERRLRFSEEAKLCAEEDGFGLEESKESDK